MQLVFYETYPTGTTDFSAILNKVKPAKPDVLAAASLLDDAVAITRQMRPRKPAQPPLGQLAHTEGYHNPFR